MRYLALMALSSAALLTACAPLRPPGYWAEPLDTTQRQAAAIEHNRLDAAKAASGEAVDPWRHMLPYDRR